MAEKLDSPPWSVWQRQIFRFTFLFVGLLMLTFPVNRPFLPDLGKLLSPVTTSLADWVARHILHLDYHYLPEIASDHTLLYVHVGNVLIISILGACVAHALDRRRLAYPRLHYVLRTAARYFLAAAMLTYGFAKVFKHQFYLPEPNILYTPMGEVSRDLLYWSTMGTSRGYSVFTGLVEVVVGLLLLWRGTSLLGALLGLGVMVQVLAINFSFDISVKVYAAFLCLLCLIIISPHGRRLLDFFRGRGVQPLTLWTPDWSSGRRRMFYALAKTAVICALLLDALGPFFQSGNFNDDLAPRPPWHGAYAVEEFVLNGDTISPDLRQNRRWQRVFVHRQGYFIVQEMDGRMQDHVLEWDTAARHITFVNPASASFGTFLYRSQGDSLLFLHGQWNQDSVAATLRTLDWRGLPLLKREFHWTSDEL